MAARLIKHLEEKAKSHSHIELLKAQWTFDQELILKALQNVGMIFPHYSRHDASHSRQILVNIERLLGDSVEKLTATDTWLILESAYWHDIGMLVSSEDIIKDVESEAFKSYVRSVSESTGHELQGFAKGFGKGSVPSCFSAAEHPQDAIEKFRQLMAGWYRQSHAKRAEKIVDDPWCEAGISSPRNELLPKRLFRVLGSVCKLHGCSFSDVMSQLSFCEAGMGNEDCHPRFVACLLRLGDLLDLDDNRFCPVMQRVAGVLPPSSHAHVHKHASIRHFRLDRDRIEVSAVCATPEGYVETDKWFRWLEDEVQKQMSHWNDIVPEREFGLLPTLGALTVELDGPNIVLEPGVRPQFGIEPLKALELFQGAGLYSDKYDCLRELIQNSIDASLIRIWLFHGPGSEHLGAEPIKDWSNPQAPEIQKILEVYKINVNLSRSSHLDKNGKICWSLKIQDHGIGISRQDLSYMLKVGGSHKNHDKRNLIASMPEWMRPSGAFGIGLQSAFLLAPEIHFNTKSAFTSEHLEIRMTSPIREELGLSQVKLLPPNIGRGVGSTLTLELIMDPLPTHAQLDRNMRTAIDDFDPVRHTEFPLEAYKAAEHLLKVTRNTLIPVNICVDGEALSFDEGRKKYAYFDKNSNIFITADFNSGESKGSTISFRGQKLKQFRQYYSYVVIAADIYGEDAQQALTINRDDVRSDARKQVQSNILRSILSLLEVEPPTTAASRINASAFLKNYNLECPGPLKNLWKQSALIGTRLTIESVLEKHQFTIFFEEDHDGEMDGTVRYVTSIEDDSLTVPHIKISHPSVRLLVDAWRDNRGVVQIDHEDECKLVIRFVKESVNFFTEAALAYALTDRNSSIRYSIPMIKKFEALAIRSPEELRYIGALFPFISRERSIVLPFTFGPKVGLDGFDELCDWVVARSIDADLTPQKARELYEELISYIDNEVMANNPRWKRLRNS